MLQIAMDAPLSAAKIADGLAITDVSMRSRLSSACKALTRSGLAVWREDDRLQIHHKEVKRLAILSGLKR